MQKQTQLEMTCLCLFLSHKGKSLWTTEEPSLTESQLRQEYLDSNGLIAKRICIESQVAYVEIDTEKTNRKDFYEWEEALQSSQSLECWRSFYFFKDSSGADWFSPKLLQGPNELEGRNVQSYYEDILRLFPK